MVRPSGLPNCTRHAAIEISVKRQIAGAILAVVTGGYMLADGLHAFMTGAYYGASLGPWAAVVRAIDIDPYSDLMKTIFVCFGALWLCSAMFWLRRAAPRFRAVMAVCTLWYFPVGTLIAILELAIQASVDRKTVA
jgi:hypothetical protein